MPIGNGDSWENVTAGLPRAAAVRAVAVHPQDPDTVFAGTQNGPYRSRDGGAKFERLDFTDTYMVGWSFQFDPHNPDIVYFGTSPAQVYRSENGGDSWESLGLNQGSDVVTMDFPTRLIAITVDPADSNLIYAALEVGGVVRSRDGGRTWQDCKEGMALMKAAWTCTASLPARPPLAASTSRRAPAHSPAKIKATLGTSST